MKEPTQVKNNSNAANATWHSPRMMDWKSMQYLMFAHSLSKTGACTGQEVRMTKDNAYTSILENVSISKPEDVKKATIVISITQEMKESRRTIQMLKRWQEIRTNRSLKTERAWADMIKEIIINLTTKRELETIQMLVMWIEIPNLAQVQLLIWLF